MEVMPMVTRVSMIPSARLHHGPIHSCFSPARHYAQPSLIQGHGFDAVVSTNLQNFNPRTHITVDERALGHASSGRWLSNASMIPSARPHHGPIYGCFSPDRHYAQPSLIQGHSTSVVPHIAMTPFLFLARRRRAAI